MTKLFLLLGLWLALVIVGVLVNGLLWLTLLGLVLIVLTAIGGAVHHTKKYPGGYDARPIRRRRRRSR